VKAPATDLYDQDFFQWTIHNAVLLRSGRLSEADLANIAEEIEAIGKNERRELESRLAVILVHLSSRRSNSWRSTIANQRAELRRLFRQSPSLQTHLLEAITEAYPDAIELAAIETGMPKSSFPDQCPFTHEQILDSDFLPD